MESDWTLQVISAGYANCGPDWHWSTGDGLPDYDIVVIESGRADYRMDGQCFEASSGTVFLFRPGDRVRGATSPNEPISAYWMHLELRDGVGRRIASDDARLPGRHRRMRSPEMIEGLLERVLDTPVPQRDVWGAAVLCELYRADRRDRWGEGDAAQAECIQALCRRIRRNPARPWRVAELAGEIGYTPDHLRRLFCKYAGRPPSEVILRARLDAARALLIDSSLSVTRIAETLGYSDVYAFCRQFRKRIGLPPGQWRRTL